MKRDNSSNLHRVRRSSRAGARFFGIVDDMARALEPTKTQLEALDSSYLSTAEFMVEAKEFDGLLLEVHGHGSRELGALVRPIDEARTGFDVDLIARLDRRAMSRYGGPEGPGQLLGDLHAVLARYAGQHGLKVHRWERCVTLEYAGGMCADIAPVIDDPRISLPFGDTCGRIPDRSLKLYDITNPRGYTKFFNQAASTQAVFTRTIEFTDAVKAESSADIAPLPSAQEVFDRLLCRLIQLLKLHRNVAFGVTPAGADAAPTSVFLTTIAAQAYLIQAPLPHDGPLDLLLDIVETMPSCFERATQIGGREVWHLQNPSVPTDNLAAGMNTPQRQQAFQQWHARVVEDINRILDALENHQGLDTLLATIKDAFGERAARSIQSTQSTHRAASRGLGRVALLPATGAPIQATARHHNFYGAR